MKPIGYAFIICGCLISCVGNAQSKSSLDSEFFDKKGLWSVVVEEPDGDGWASNMPSTASFKGLLDDTFLVEDVKLVSSNGVVNMHIIFGVDPRSGDYRVMALDKEFGTMDVYKGSYQHKVLTVTNLEDEGFVLEDGSGSMHFQLNYDLSKADSVILLVNFSLDDGENWEPFQRVNYTRADLP